jgi:cytochrome o ubiquinol oxidase operon protein cyoD
MSTTAKHQHSTTPYIIGFASSIALTVSAYYFVQLHLSSGHRTPSDHILPALLACLAVIQLVVQLRFFLHVGQEPKPRWKLVALISAIIVVLTLVLGSIWIMDNLNYNMRTPQQTNTYLQSQDGL